MSGGRRAAWWVALMAAVTVVGLAVLAAPETAQAHSADESYVYLDVGDRDLRGQVELAYVDVETVFGIDLGGDEQADRAALRGAVDELHEYASEIFSIGGGGSPWPVRFDGVLTLEEWYDVEASSHAILPFVVDLGGADVPQVLEVRFEPFFDEIDDRNALLLISNDWRRGIFDNEAEALVRFDPGDRTQSIDLGDASQWRNFTESISLGVDHIRTGPDHIFFVLVLLLPSVLVLSAGRRAPTATFGAALWRILKIVSMFTIAHSITFTLAGLGILPLPPSRLVETVIAASIAAAALYNLRPVAGDREWLIAFGFGLFHGMGFAGLVSELEVGKTTQLVSLLGRNVGIEIGQAVVVLLMFPGLFVLRRTTWYRPALVAGSVALAIVSLIWMVERMFDVDAGISDFVDKVIRFPRVLALVAAFTAIAAAVYAWERTRNRLLPVADRSAAAEPEPEPELTGVGSI